MNLYAIRVKSTLCIGLFGLLVMGMPTAFAQRIPANASPGAILGWEMNMNNQYSKMRDIPFILQNQDAKDEPVIFYEGKPVNLPDNNDLPPLLRNQPTLK